VGGGGVGGRDRGSEKVHRRSPRLVRFRQTATRYGYKMISKKRSKKSDHIVLHGMVNLHDGSVLDLIVIQGDTSILK